MKQYKTTIVDGYVLIVDDSYIKEGDFTYHHVKGIYNAVIDGAYTNQKKIIAQLPLNNSLVLQGIPLLPPIQQEDDVEKLTIKEWKSSEYRTCNPPHMYDMGFKDGYKIHAEKYKYTDNQIRMTYMQGYNRGKEGNPNEMEKYIEFLNQSVQQIKIPTKFICEIEVNCTGNNDNGCFLDSCGHNCGCEFKPKTISTPNGEQWIGEWVY